MRRIGSARSDGTSRGGEALKGRGCGVFHVLSLASLGTVRHHSRHRQVRRPILNQVQVLPPADVAAPQGVRASAMQTTDLLRRTGEARPDAPASFETYFRLLYQATALHAPSREVAYAR